MPSEPGHVVVRNRIAQQLAEDAGVGHAKRLVDERGGEAQAGAATHFQPGVLMKLQRIDEDAVVVEDREHGLRIQGRASALGPVVEGRNISAFKRAPSSPKGRGRGQGASAESGSKF